MLVDSHCHLNYDDFAGETQLIIDRAREAGVSTFLTINTRLNEAPELIELAEANADIFCTIGVHPHDAKDYVGSDLISQLSHLATHPKVVGLGETGLDYHYDNSPRDQQQIAFQAHIEVGKTQNLPLVIHTREADEDTVRLLKGQNIRGVFHCFSGSKDLARQALDLGFFISFSGIITFKKAEELREIVAWAPMDRILIETDAPFLAPVPHRGQRNEPAFVREVAQKVADIRGLTFEAVAEKTSDNFFCLFDRAKRS